MNFKNKYFWIVLVLLVVVIGIYYSSQKGNKGLSFNKIDDTISQIFENNVYKEFIVSFPQFSGIDINKKNCFDFGGVATGESSIECFIPANYSELLKSKQDPIKYENALKKAKHVQVSFVEDSKKNPFLQFYDMIQPSNLSTNSGSKLIYKDIKKSLNDLIKNGDYKKQDLFNYAYLQSLEGNYEYFEKVKEKICSNYKSFCNDSGSVIVTVSGKVFDDNGNPLEGALVKILGYNYSDLTSKDGSYSIVLKGVPIQRVRIMATKKGYNIGVFPFDILSIDKSQFRSKDFTLIKAEKVVEIDTIDNVISGEGCDKNDKGFLVKTSRSEYEIPYDSIKTYDGNLYKGKLKVYFFEFNKSSKIDDLLQNDIFDDIVGYAGNIMKTFGMPFVVFVSDSGEMLHIFSDNPMILESTIQEMNALRTNQDKIYQPLTDQDLDFLYNKSNELGGYPIDRLFLASNGLFRFPAFWVFDQKRGIWDNIGVKLISKDGVIETKFYTILK